MAHIEKYKASAVGGMLHHYQRDREGVLARENVDETRTAQNYAIVFTDEGKLRRVPPPDNSKTVSERVRAVETASAKKVRKDAVVMADMVVTLPKNVPEKDALKFFAYSYSYMAKLVGKDNLMGGYVHMDETTPHMHVPFTPILDGRFCYKKMITRSVYQQFHKGLGDYLEKSMGYRPAVEIEDAGEKRLSRLSQEEYKEVKAAQKSLEQERAAKEQQLKAVEQKLESKAVELEAAEYKLADVQQWAVTLDQKSAELDAQIQEQQQRLESLRQEGDSRAARVEQLESAVAVVAEAKSEGKAGTIPALDKLNQWADGFRAELEARVRQLGNRVEQLRGRLFELTHPRAQSLAEQLADAREAAAAYNSQRPRTTRSRGLSR